MKLCLTFSVYYENIYKLFAKKRSKNNERLSKEMKSSQFSLLFVFAKQKKKLKEF